MPKKEPEPVISPDSLRRRYEEMNHAQVTELDKAEEQISKRWTKQRRQLLLAAGQQTCILAGLGEQYEAQVLGYD